MSRGVFVLLAALCGLAAGIGADRHSGSGGLAAQLQSAPAFRSRADLVSVDVSVRDRTRVVKGLLAKDFEVLDNGVPQQIADLSYEKLPIDVTVALDVSSSVSGATLDRLKRAIVQLMSDLGKDDRLALIAFNMRVSRVVNLTNDIPAVERAIGALSAGGGTSVFDTISVALVAADHPDRRQLIVLFTDGGDAMSGTEPETLRRTVQHTNATLTAVLPGASGAPPPTGAPQVDGVQKTLDQVYRDLTSDTGGIVIPLRSSDKDLTATFRRALEEFRSSYVLYFVPNGPAHAGFHTLQVTVPARKPLSVRARRGYWSD